MLYPYFLGPCTITILADAGLEQLSIYVLQTNFYFLKFYLCLAPLLDNFFACTISRKLVDAHSRTYISIVNVFNDILLFFLMGGVSIIQVHTLCRQGSSVGSTPEQIML